MTMTNPARVRALGSNPEIAWAEMCDLVDELQNAATNEVVDAEVASADGAIASIAGLVVITKTSAAALTLAAPATGTDDGKRLRIVSTTAFKHAIVTPSNKLNGNATTVTFTGAKGDTVNLEAYNGVWWSPGQRSVLAAGEVKSADGAISIVDGGVAITKSAAIAALTLAAPVATTDDYKTLRIVSTTARAHTITTPSNKINGAASIVTLGGAIGDAVTLMAYQGVWYSLSGINAVIS